MLRIWLACALLCLALESPAQGDAGADILPLRNFFTVQQDSIQTLPLAFNDPRASGARYRVDVVRRPTNGTLAGSGTTLLYTPRPRFAGADTFEFRVTNLVSGGTSPAIVARLWVDDGITPNRPPEARNQTATAILGEPALLRLDVDDLDSPGPFSISIVQAPSLGRLTPTDDPLVWTYRAPPGTLGQERFTWRASDGAATSAPATFTVVLGAEPAPPPPPPQPPAPGNDVPAANPPLAPDPARPSAEPGMALGLVLDLRLGADFDRPPGVRRLDGVQARWGNGRPDPAITPDGFCAEWHGFLIPPQTGTYTFTLDADDHASLELDGMVLLDVDVAGRTTPSQPVLLTQGRPHAIRLRHRDVNGSAVCVLSWRRPDGLEEPVPLDVLRPPARLADGPPLIVGLTAPNVPVPDGSPVELRVAAAGPEPIAYQWEWNDRPIASARDAVFRIERFEPRHAGLFRVRVSNRAGTTSSEPRVVRVLGSASATSAAATARPDLLAYEGFAGRGPVHGTGHPLGWAEPWTVQEEDEGFRMAQNGGATETFPVEPGILWAAARFRTVNRRLDLVENGPFDGLIQPDGTLVPNTDVWISVIAGIEKLSDGVHLGLCSGFPGDLGLHVACATTLYTDWHVRLFQEEPVSTGRAVEFGKPVLLVLRVRAVAGGTAAALYVNPPLTGELPGRPDASITSPRRPVITSVVVRTGNDVGDGWVDDVRVGRTYRSVLPVP